MPKHKWREIRRDEHTTTRACERGCGVFRLTRHEPPLRPWIEFWRGTERLTCDATPPCEPPAAEAEEPAGTAPQHENAASACRPDDQVRA